MTLVLPILTMAVIGCADNAPSSSVPGDSASAVPTPSVGASERPNDLSAIACATDDPEDVGELTGAWAGDDGGVYYIRQVGDCVWWFGTELDDVAPAGQSGFANVASGRVQGIRIEVEWADIPLGNILGGGGLTLIYDPEIDQLAITQQRGDWISFGATTFTRIAERDPSPTEEQGKRLTVAR